MCDEIQLCIAYIPMEAGGQGGLGPLQGGGAGGRQLEIVRGVHFLRIFGDFCLDFFQRNFPEGVGSQAKVGIQNLGTIFLVRKFKI